MIYRFLWVLKTLMYAPFLGGFGFPSYIANPIYLRRLNRIFIGKRVRILPHSRIEVTSKMASIVFEDNISVGQNFHITAGGNLLIKKNTLITENVMITDIDHNYQDIDIPILDQEYIIRKTEIGENCYIGFGVVIQAGTILGKQCVVGANSVVRGSFPEYSVIVGAPGRIVKRYNIKSNKWERTDKNGEFNVN
tara:strand:- start:124 stop:702 length:579 start_codon:yes stop_codon:yes gene_type:complete